MLSYSINILVITILISTSLYAIFIVSIKQSSIESTQQLLAQLVRHVDILKNDVDNVMTVITNDSKTLKFVQNKVEIKQDNYYLFLKLLDIKSAYSYIENISVINLDSSICIQAIGSNFNNNDNIKYASVMLDQQKFIDVRSISLQQGNKNVVTFLQYLPYYNAVVIEDVNADWFKYSINSEPQEKENVYIIDREGRAVTNDSAEYLGNQPLSDYFMSIIMKNNSLEESFVYDDKEQRQLVFFSWSQNYGWWFIDVQDYSYVNSKFQNVGFIFIISALTFVLFSALISIIFHRKIRKHLARLANKCRNIVNNDETSAIDEFKYIDIAIAKGRHEKYLRDNYINMLYLYNLLVGKQMPLFVSQKELDQLKHQYHWEQYCVMLFNIKESVQLDEATRKKEFDIYRYAISNLADEIFGNEFVCKSIDMGEESVGLLLFLEREEISSNYELCFKQLREFTYEMFRITISGSLGVFVNKQEDIYISYQKARQYLEMNQLIGREELIDANNQVSVSYQEKNQKLVESIIEYTESNFNDPDLSLKSVSQIFGLSTSYIGKIFRSIKGEAYSSFLTRYRLEKSKLALLQTTKTISDISSEIGFTNSTYYSTLFKNAYGMTPSAFREKMDLKITINNK